MSTPTNELPPKLIAQLGKMRLPLRGAVSFEPQLTTSRSGEQVLARGQVEKGPRRGKLGLVDIYGRIWVRDFAHADVPEHWDVQINGGTDYIRVGYDGELI